MFFYLLLSVAIGLCAVRSLQAQDKLVARGDGEMLSATMSGLTFKIAICKAMGPVALPRQLY